MKTPRWADFVVLLCALLRATGCLSRHDQSKTIAVSVGDKGTGSCAWLYYASVLSLAFSSPWEFMVDQVVHQIPMHSWRIMQSAKCFWVRVELCPSISAFGAWWGPMGQLFIKLLGMTYSILIYCICLYSHFTLFAIMSVSLLCICLTFFFSPSPCVDLHV